jgi:membrane protein
MVRILSRPRRPASGREDDDNDVAVAEPDAAATPQTGLVGFVKRLGKRIMRAKVPDSAAALTYYNVMALVPSLLVVLAVVGLVADPQQLFNRLTNFFKINPNSGLASTLHSFLHVLTRQTGGGAPALIGFGTIVALWSFSGAMANLLSTVNSIWEREESRNFAVKRVLGLGLALLAAVVALVGIAAIGLAAGVGHRIVEKASLGSEWSPILSYVPFVLMLALLTCYLAVVYWIAPEKEARSWRWVSLGAVVGTAIWLLATIGFALYVTTFASYNRVYGPLAAPIIALFWIYLSNMAILIGACVDAERDAGARLSAPPT